MTRSRNRESEHLQGDHLKAVDRMYNIDKNEWRTSGKFVYI